MDYSRFGRTVGTKFNADGSVIRFPGNTVISKVTPDMPVFSHISEIRDFLKENDGGCVAYLPDESWHMTVIEGLCDQVRDPAHWSSKLKNDAKLSEADTFLSR